MKWVYHSPGTLLDEEAWKKENAKTRLWAEPSPAIRSVWEQLMSKHPSSNIHDRAGMGGYEQLNNNIFTAKTLAERFNRSRAQAGTRADSFELYESKIPHFYLAFLSVPGHLSQDDKVPISAPKGTYGFVQLYQHFVTDYVKPDYVKRTGLYLESPGAVLDYYFWSTVQLFHEGVKRGYLHRTYP